MEIIIKETNEIKELTIIDPRTGLDWAADLTGDDDNIYFDGDHQSCDQETFEWWEDLINRYQTADERYYNLLNILDDNAKESLSSAVQDAMGCDIENCPELLNYIIDNWLKDSLSVLSR